MFMLCQFMWILHIKAKYLKENVITRIIKVKARQWFYVISNSQGHIRSQAQTEVTVYD